MMLGYMAGAIHLRQMANNLVQLPYRALHVPLPGYRGMKR
jgi:hypothetical protein